MASRQTNVSQRARRRRSRLRFLLLGLFVAGGIAALFLPFLLLRNMMSSGMPLQTARQFALASPNAQTNIALEVTSLPTSTLLTGTLLQKNADDSYSRTDQKVTVQWNSAQLVMGNSSDVKQGAILQVDGRVGDNGVLRASQVVILTGMVQVKH